MRIMEDENSGYYGGWHGDLLDTWRGEDELVKAIRAGLKEISPDCKWSVTKLKTRLTPHITVRLMEAPEYPIRAWNDENCQYCANDVDGCYRRGYADWFNEVLLNVENFLDSLNYDHSDPMRDYFDVGFYAHIDIGKWDKPFKLKGAKK